MCSCTYPVPDKEITGDNFYGNLINNWQGWDALDGQIIGEPAVFSRRPDITDIFARGKDNKLWQKSWARDHWTDWRPHNDGFFLDSSPVADSMGPDHIHIFARGQDGQLWQKPWTVSSGWMEWRLLGGGITGAPGVRSRRPDITDVFARRVDNRLWQKTWERDHWTPWIPHNDGFILDSSPVADSMGPDHIQVFARGQDGQLWHKTWTASGGWMQWQPLGGEITGIPGVRSRRPDITDVFIRGANNKLWQKTCNHGLWTGWSQHDDDFSLDSSPVVDSMGPDHVHIFTRGQDGWLWQKRWTAKSAYAEYFWKTYGFNGNEAYWDGEFGLDDPLNTDKALARTYNALFALTYSAQDYKNDNWDAPQGILQWGRRFVRENIDNIRAMCNKDGAFAEAFRGFLKKGRVQLYLPFFYRQYPPERAATLIHEARHMNAGKEHIDGKDPNWAYDGCYKYEVCYLAWFYTSAVRTTVAMRERARQRANIIIDNRFIEHPGFNI